MFAPRRAVSFPSLLLPACRRLPDHPAAEGRELLTTSPTFDHLYRLFPDSPDRPDAVEVPADDVPEPYHRLLVHTHHMTVTVEDSTAPRSMSGCWTCRRTRQRIRTQDPADRSIRLARVVQFGLVRINLGVCTEAGSQRDRRRQNAARPRADPARHAAPHRAVAYLRVTLSETMAEWFRVAAGYRIPLAAWA